MRRQWVLLSAVSLLVVNVAVWALLWPSSAAPQTSATTAQESKRYPYLSRRIFVDDPNDILLNFAPLRNAIKSKFTALPSGTEYSFYFEYLPSGTSIRIGEDNELVAASLIKLPLTMNLYKAAELGKINLDETVTITTSELDGGYGDLWQQGAGKKLTLRQAAKYALEQSDNTAAHVIFDNVNGLLTSDQESLNNLDIDQTMTDGQAVINAKSYTSILKSLYLSSYLQRQDSQELLGYLTHSDATNRLQAGVPSGVTVAHKIGVYNTNWSESDCGIVYLPKRPYAICVMVGLPDSEANTFIADISKQIYTYVSQAGK